MSNTEETNKLSAEEELLNNKKNAILNCALAGCYNIHGIKISEKYTPHLLIAMDGFASMRVEQERKDKNAIIEQVKFLLIRNGELEQAKKEWSEEKQGLKAKIKHLTQVINYQG